MADGQSANPTHPASEPSNPILAALVGLFFLLLSVVWALQTFGNFSSLEVVGAIGIMAVVPAILLVSDLGRTISVPPSSLLWASSLALVLAMGLALHSASALAAGSDYASILPNHRLEVGGGFHQDAVFHVAIIQNIQNSGLPSTGQHLSPFLHYHVLSHYVHAGLVKALGLDAWESYALLFHAKAVLVTLLLVRLASKQSTELSFRWFLLALALLATVFIGAWDLVGSHGQWFGGAVLIGAGPALQATMSRREPGLAGWLLFSLVYVVLLLSKISMGFAFAAAILAWVFLRAANRWIALFVGLAWSSLGFLQASAYRWENTENGLLAAIGYPNDGVTSRLQFSGTVLIGCAIISIVLYLIARWNNSTDARDGSAAAGVATASATLVAVFFANGASDAYYFVIGALYANLILFGWIPFSIARSLPRDLDSGHFAAMHSASVGGLVMLIGFTPILQSVYLGPFNDVATLGSRLRSIPAIGSEWQEPREVAQFARKPSSATTQVRALDSEDDNPYFAQLRNVLDAEISSAGFRRGEVFLFLSQEDFDLLVGVFNLRREWATGLLVTAVTGLPLVHGVPADVAIGGYGFTLDPTGESFRRSKDDVQVGDLCQFGRPIAVFEDILDLRANLICVS